MEAWEWDSWSAHEFRLNLVYIPEYQRLHCDPCGRIYHVPVEYEHKVCPRCFEREDNECSPLLNVSG